MYSKNESKKHNSDSELYYVRRRGWEKKKQKANKEKGMRCINMII